MPTTTLQTARSKRRRVEGVCTPSAAAAAQRRHLLTPSLNAPTNIHPPTPTRHGNARTLAKQVLKAKQDEERGPKLRRPHLASECHDLNEADKWRSQILREVGKKVMEIQNSGLGEHRCVVQLFYLVHSSAATRAIFIWWWSGLGVEEECVCA